ncbi:hypothetical protein BFP75_02610 [Maribacter sp. 4G9]|nr:hypothetical protein BFP75_02610 [Maribacter sp. 4G9]
MGKSNIHENFILITEYPFEPSFAYPEKRIKADEIQSICVEFGICKIYVAGDIVFVSSEKKECLKRFAENNDIVLSEHSWNWDWILEPYLDTEFTAANEKLVQERLLENGIEKKEIDKIHTEVGKQMYKYNFDTMLWDWTSLGLADVLSAMRAKYNKEKFRDFYKRALEIDRRGKNKVNTTGNDSTKL